MKTKDDTNATQAEPTTDAERFAGFAKQVVSVPKSEIDKRQTEWEKQQAKKKAAKKA